MYNMFTLHSHKQNEYCKQTWKAFDSIIENEIPLMHTKTHIYKPFKIKRNKHD